MNRIILYTALTVLMIGMTASQVDAQRGRGGGGGGGRGVGGGGNRGGGGFTAPARPAPQAAPRPAPAAAPRPAQAAPQRPATTAAPRTTTTGTGPGGGSYQAGKGGGTHTTQGGATITTKGAAIGGTTAGGTTGGKYVGGVQITTAGGQTINHVGKGGAATGPGGNTVAGRAGATGTTGPQGSGATASRGAVATGPGGTAAARSAVATGPGGTAAYRGAAAATPHGTYYRSAAAVSGQGVAVRAGASNYYGCFNSAWYAKYPGAWTAARWGTAAAWTAAGWGSVSSYCGYPAETTSYDYGSTVVYQDDGVYVNGDNVGTPQQYAEQATAIAEEGKKAEASKDDEWKSLGVFAMVQAEQTTSNNIFQLAINKAGVIRGNYYNAITDSTEPVFGQVDKKTQRAAWIVGDKKAPTYEAGIFNMTEEQTTMMVHYSKDKSQQFMLVRIEKPEDQ